MSGTSVLTVPERQPFILLFPFFFFFFCGFRFHPPEYLIPYPRISHLPGTPYILTVENDRSVEVSEIMKIS